MIRVFYFARLAEQLDLRQESIEADEAGHSIANLIDLLRRRGEPFESAFNGETPLLVAINQEMCDLDAAFDDGDEIAFFPPVTGG